MSKGTLLFVKPKRFAFVDPAIKAQISGVGNNLYMTLQADAFAKDVEISFDGIDAMVSENYFDITSSSPVKVGLTIIEDTPTSSYELQDALRIRCVNTIKKVNKSLKNKRFDTKKQDIMSKLNFDLDATYQLLTEKLGE